MSAPYRGASRWPGCLWVLMILLGLACQVGVFIWLGPEVDRLQGWVFAVAVLPLIVSLFLAAWVMGRLDRTRILGIRRTAVAEGLEFVYPVDASMQGHLQPHMETLGPRFGLANGVQGLKWVAFSSDVLVFEHEFTTGSGKTTQVHTRTVAAWPATAPLPKAKMAEDPMLWMLRPRLGETRLYAKTHGPEFQIGVDAFDRQWLLYGSQETAANFLDEATRDRLVRSPKGETWMVGGGWCAASYPGPIDEANLGHFLHHARAALGASG